VLLLETLQAVANYVTARFGSRGSSLTAQDVAELKKQTSLWSTAGGHQRPCQLGSHRCDQSI